MRFRVYRDFDARLRLRKWVVELRDGNDQLLHRARLFGGLFFIKRLELLMRLMKYRADQIFELYGKV